MHKFILMILLSVVSNSALAEWVKVEDNNEFTIYVDSESRTSNDAKVKLWTLIDFNAAKIIDGKSYMSFIEQDEFDCKAGVYRSFYLEYRSRNMGAGEIVFSNALKVRDWEAIVPASFPQKLWNVACANQQVDIPELRINKGGRWTAINVERGAILYADRTSIRKNGYFVTMWDLQDLIRPIGGEGISMPFMSTKGQREYDCKNEKFRSLSLTTYSGNMGSGQFDNSSSKRSEWRIVPPDSIAETLWKTACGK